MDFQASTASRNIQPSATLKLNALVQEMRAKGHDIIGLAAGEPDFNTPAHIIDAAKQAMSEGCTRYTPVSGIPQLKKAIIDTLLKDKNLLYENKNILISMGAKQALYQALRVILNPGDEVLLPAPCWLSYKEMITMCSAVPVPIHTTAEQGYVPDIESFYEKYTDRTKLILINSPNNPTGAVWERKILKEIAEFAKDKNLLILSDEIYEKIVYGDAHHVSIAALSEDAKERTVVVNGFSKAYAMTGWRLGYSSGNEKIIAAMDAYQSHAAGCSNSIAQYAAVEALNGTQKPLYDMVQVFNRRRELMVDLINDIPNVRCFEPKGAFYVLLDISPCLNMKCHGTPITSDMDFAHLLLAHNRVSAVPGNSFYAPNCLRLSYAVKDENIFEAMKRLKEFVLSLD